MKDGAFMSKREIDWMYRTMEKRNFRKIWQKLTARRVYILADYRTKDAFEDSVQGKGVYVFTDYPRAQSFLAGEKNRNLNTFIADIPFAILWHQFHSDIYVNLTPYGDDTVFIKSVYADDGRCLLGTKATDNKFHYPDE